VKAAIRRLEERDLAQADRIFRLAFGTFLGLPDPLAFGGDADYVRTRWRAAPEAALGAYLEGELVGSNFAARWGSFAFFGPLTVRPDLWDRGVARGLLGETIALFDAWGVRQRALFTFPHSPKHVALYQKYGFWPQHLTAIMAMPTARRTRSAGWTAFSEMPNDARKHWLDACRALTHAVFPGLDVSREIEAVESQRLGDTVLVHEGDALAAFAVCHLGAGSEAGSGAAYVKFGAARPGADAARHFDHLLESCEELAASRGADRLVAGVNAARHAGYRRMIERGFRTQIQGVAMQSGPEAGWNRPECFVLDDWR
jgi:GNAT superfamily N-acetyltransferase